LDLIILADSITRAAMLIEAGRKGFATRGKEQEGRINYETGIAKALSSFQEAQTTADPQTILLAEYTFISQELQLLKINIVFSLPNIFFCQNDEKC